MIKKPALLALLAFCWPPPVSAEPTYLLALIHAAHDQRLAQERPWRLLLHDRRNLWGFYGSEMDDKEFFLDPRGRRDPSAELDATLKAFFEPPSADPENQHPQCRYPA